MNSALPGGDPERLAERLADAPLVITGSRRKIGSIAVISLGFICVGGWEARQQETWLGVPIAVVGWGALVFGALGLAVAAAQLVRPPNLTFTTESLKIQTLGRSSDLRWSEIERFHAWRPATSRQSLVGYTRRGAPRTRTEGLSRGLGSDGAITNTFPISPPALLALCEACRRRWG